MRRTKTHRLQRVGGEGFLNGRQLHRLDVRAHHVGQTRPQLPVRPCKQRNCLYRERHGRQGSNTPLLMTKGTC
jgi:hypothetical protein